MTDSIPPLPAEDIEHILRHTRELWAAATAKSFFITGGTGFFGIWLLESFAHANDALGLNARAVVLSRNPTAFRRRAPHLANRSDITFVQGDVRTFTLTTGKYEYVIHAATEVADRDKQSAVDESSAAILEGTQRVIDFAAAARTKHLLFVSSGAAYGTQPADLTHMPETYAGSPNSDSGYGIGKHASEQLLMVGASKHDYRLKIARCFSFVGPHLDADRYAIGNFMRDAIAGRSLKIHGDGTPQRSYMYAADLVIWLWTILFNGTASRMYNVGSSNAITILDCAKAVAETVNPLLVVEVAKQGNAAMTIERYVPHTGRAGTELGLLEKIPLPEAIRRTVAWLQNSPPIS